MPLACGSGCAHPVSLAHSTCALFPVSRVRRWCAVQHAIFRLSLISLRTKCTVDVELLAAFLDVDLHAVTTTLLWRRKWWMHIIHGQGVDRLRLQPVGSPWLSHVASVMLPQSRGSSCGARAAAWPPRDIRPKNLDELVGPSFACEMVQRLFAEESGSSAGAVDCRNVDPRVGKGLQRRKDLCEKIDRKLVIIVESLLSGKNSRPTSHYRCAHPEHCFEAPDPVVLATDQSFARMSVDTNEPDLRLLLKFHLFLSTIVWWIFCFCFPPVLCDTHHTFYNKTQN